MTFDSHFVGSLPCMPAPRDLHTDRLNFMHRSWGPARAVRQFLPGADLFKEAGLAPPPDRGGRNRRLRNAAQSAPLLRRRVPGREGQLDLPFILGAGASVAKDPPASDYTVSINSPARKKALDLFIDIAKRCGPPNAGALGQSDVIQLLATGKAAQGLAGAAAWPNFEDPAKSAVIGKLNAVPVPRPASGKNGDAIGNWHFVVPKTVPEARKKAVIAFSKWFLTQAAQKAYLESGGIPVRSDVLTDDLAAQPKYRWVKAYLETQNFASQVLGFSEGPQVEQALGLRLNQALIGEISAATALNAAAKEIEEIFRRSGRRTGLLPPLPENRCARRPWARPGPPPLGAMPWLDRSFRWWSLLPAALLFAALTVYPIANLVWMSLSTVEFAQGKASGR
jgi:multiple sugar transport system substrate-binding protein